MLLALKIHPDSRCEAVSALTVEIARLANGSVVLRYEANGRIDRLKLPVASAPVRADELWRHTCFEAFAAAGEGYAEFNFSPSTCWAAYAFEGYRAGMCNADIAPPEIEIHRDQNRLALIARVQLPAAGRLGLSAVIEETSGEKSYWAFAHPPGKPDFHHPDSFAIDLETL